MKKLHIIKWYPHLSNSIADVVSVVASVVVLSSVIFLGANGNIVKEGKATGPTFFVKVVNEGKPTDSDEEEESLLLSIGNMLKEGNPTDSDSDDNSLVNNLCVDDSGV